MKSDVLAWKAAALADNWYSAPKYLGESEETAAILRRDGFQAYVVARDPPHEESVIYLWGLDQLHITVNYPYSWGDIQREMLRCIECGEIKPKIRRVGFSHRCCEACLPEARKKYEYKGWNE